jgi:hypothetical protein
VSDKSNIQLDVCKVFSLDIESIACLIEQTAGPYLKEAPKGIFTPAKLEPAMVDGRRYFIRVQNRRTGTTEDIPINDLENAPHTTVYALEESSDFRPHWNKQNAFGLVRPVRQNYKERVAIPQIFMGNKKRFLSTKPILPYRGIKVIELLVDDCINHHVKYPRAAQDPTDYIYSQFKEEYLRGDYQSNLDPLVLYIESVADILLCQLRAFMAGFEWHLYFVSVVGSKLFVEMSVDQRAYLWMLEQERLMILRQNEEELRG